MAGEPGPAPPIATFYCGECGARASDVRFLPPTVIDHDLAARPGTPQGVMEIGADQPRLAIHGGPVTVQIHPLERAAEVAQAVQHGDARALFGLDQEYAPFWCPRCSAAYCDDHWDVEVLFDDGFYDRQMGTCPRGHRRKLMD